HRLMCRRVQRVVRDLPVERADVRLRILPEQLCDRVRPPRNVRVLRQRKGRVRSRTCSCVAGSRSSECDARKLEATGQELRAELLCQAKATKSGGRVTSASGAPADLAGYLCVRECRLLRPALRAKPPTSQSEPGPQPAGDAASESPMRGQ